MLHGAVSVSSQHGVARQLYVARVVTAMGAEAPETDRQHQQLKSSCACCSDMKLWKCMTHLLIVVTVVLEYVAIVDKSNREPPDLHNCIASALTFI